MNSLFRTAGAALLLLSLSCLAQNIAQPAADAAAAPDAAPAGANRRVVILVRELEPFLVAFKTVDAMNEGSIVKASEIVIIA